MGANENEDRRMLLLPLSRLQWVSGSLAVSKSNPVFVVELVFRVGAAMNDTTVAQLIFITPFPVNFVTFFNDEAHGGILTFPFVQSHSSYSPSLAS